MTKGGFIVEYLAARKSENGWQFLWYLIKYNIFGMILLVYWAVVMTLCWLVIIAVCLAIGYEFPPPLGYVLAASVGISLIYYYGFSTEKYLLQFVQYMLD
jgi:hypothetical protein